MQEQLKSPAPALVQDKSGNFVRVIGPNSYPSFGIPNHTPTMMPGVPFTPYRGFLDYWRYLIKTFGPGTSVQPPFTSLGNGKIANVAGVFAGSGQGSGNASKKQTYELTANIDESGQLTLKGTGSVVGDIKMTITELNLLTPAAACGGAPLFSLNGAAAQPPANDLYSWILGDFFSGLNIGALGSAKIDPSSGMSSPVGEWNSSQWFQYLPKAGLLYDKLWGEVVKDHWNRWSRVLNSRSDAYNFAYAERFSSPQLSLDATKVDTLKLTLLDAAI